MNKMEGKSLDLEKLNIEKIKELFPNVVTEGKVDFDKLRIILGDQIDDRVEKYQFTWNGKSDTIKLAQTPSTGTLIPSKEDSKNWDTTGNLYIEGDNLEVLKQLQKTYYGKIKMIYIDPPYNTGGDFVYKDDFKDNIKNYKEQTQQTSRANPETNGRYHTDWLNMMYSRLMLAKNLLSNEGVIFISIDENENYNLIKLCNEIFGEFNRISDMVNITGASQNGEGVLIQKNYETCLVYCKNLSLLKINKVDKANESLRSLADAPTPLNTRPDMGYTIYYNELNDDIIPLKDYDKNLIHSNDEKVVYKNNKKLIDQGYIPIRPGKKNNLLHRWRWGFETFIERKDEIIIQKTNGNFIPYFRQSGYNPPRNILNYSVGTNEVKKIFDDTKLFEFPKSTNMLKYLISIGTNSDDIVIDFFSGSATTAHAVMQLNAEDGGNRKFIMVQLPELTDESSEAYKAGYKNLCEIGKERIRRAGEQIKQELIEKKNKAGLLDDNIIDPETFDNGFKVFKLDSTNINPWDGTIKLNDETIFSQTEVIKEDRSTLDVLYEIMLKYGVFDKPVKEIKVNTKTMHSVADGYLIVCLDNHITLEDVREIGKLKPRNVIFKESGFANDNDKINATYTLEKLGVEEIKSI